MLFANGFWIILLGTMKTRHFLSAAAIGFCAYVSAFSQGSLVINDPTTADAPGAITSDNKYKLTAAEQSVMDKYIYPKARARLKEGCDAEALEISGRHQGSFTKAGADQTAIFYQYCQTGNGIGSAGLVILENGKPVANFIAEQAGWT